MFQKNELMVVRVQDEKPYFVIYEEDGRGGLSCVRTAEGRVEYVSRSNLRSAGLFVQDLPRKD